MSTAYYNSRIKILVNLAPLKKGGGQNVGLNFLSYLLVHRNSTQEYFIIVAKNSQIHKLLAENNYNDYIIFPSNPIIRIVYELIYSRKIINEQKIDIVYSYFGMGFYPKKIKQVTGSADSNLYFPEIKFWEGYGYIKYLLKILIDKYRIWGLYRAKGIIFENEVMEKRFHQLFNSSAKTIYIKPSISLNYKSVPFYLPDEIQSRKNKGLFLCGWHLNKNVMLIPEIAFELNKKNIDIHLILTAPQDNSSMHRKFCQLVKQYNVEKNISIVDDVPKEQLASLYNQIDIVFLLSKLESFSNNIIEAWHFKKLLVVSNEEWAKSICKDAAAYVQRNSAKSIANSIQCVLSNKDEYQKIIDNGTSELSNYPTIAERFEKEIEFLEYVYAKS